MISMNSEYKDKLIVTISESEATDMIERIARIIAERHMGSAGILLLESLRPLHGIGSQAMYFLLPFAQVFFDSKKYQHFALMIQDEKYLKRLIERIDEMDEEINRERRERRRILKQRRRAKRTEFFNRLFKKKEINS